VSKNVLQLLNSPQEVPTLDREALKYLTDEQVTRAWKEFLAQVAVQLLQAHANVRMDPSDQGLRDQYERAHRHNRRLVEEYEARWRAFEPKDEPSTE
jgi:GAF domain-containing protein